MHSLCRARLAATLAVSSVPKVGQLRDSAAKALNVPCLAHMRLWWAHQAVAALLVGLLSDSCRSHSSAQSMNAAHQTGPPDVPPRTLRITAEAQFKPSCRILCPSFGSAKSRSSPLACEFGTVWHSFSSAAWHHVSAQLAQLFRNPHIWSVVPSLNQAETLLLLPARWVAAVQR
jgi:hypothetical protein